MQAGFKNTYDCSKVLSEMGFTEDLKKMGVLVLILHGDDDQIVPIGASSGQMMKLVPNGTLKVYPGGGMGCRMSVIGKSGQIFFSFWLLMRTRDMSCFPNGVIETAVEVQMKRK